MQKIANAISQTVFATHSSIREIKNVATMTIKNYCYPIIEGHNVNTHVAMQHIIKSFSMRDENGMYGLQIKISTRKLSALGLQTFALLQLTKEVLLASISF